VNGRRRNPGPRDEWLIRVFNDSAETPVWYRNPLDHDEMALSPALRSGLEAFSAWFAEVELPRGYGVEPDVRTAFETEGERLAQALALEVGEPFKVEVIHPDMSSGKRRYKHACPGTNPAAGAAFHALHDARGRSNTE
jgi:hypothetical protein